jgi:hypothetical protein
MKDVVLVWNGRVAKPAPRREEPSLEQIPRPSKRLTHKPSPGPQAGPTAELDVVGEDARRCPEARRSPGGSLVGTFSARSLAPESATPRAQRTETAKAELFAKEGNAGSA